MVLIFVLKILMVDMIGLDNLISTYHNLVSYCPDNMCKLRIFKATIYMKITFFDNKQVQLTLQIKFLKYLKRM